VEIELWEVWVVVCVWRRGEGIDWEGGIGVFIADGVGDCAVWEVLVLGFTERGRYGDRRGEERKNAPWAKGLPPDRVLFLTHVLDFIVDCSLCRL
jgi:hypothetical protein